MTRGKHEDDHLLIGFDIRVQADGAEIFEMEGWAALYKGWVINLEGGGTLYIGAQKKKVRISINGVPLYGMPESTKPKFHNIGNFLVFVGVLQTIALASYLIKFRGSYFVAAVALMWIASNVFFGVLIRKGNHEATNPGIGVFFLCSLFVGGANLIVGESPYGVIISAAFWTILMLVFRPSKAAVAAENDLAATFADRVIAPAQDPSRQ